MVRLGVRGVLLAGLLGILASTSRVHAEAGALLTPVAEEGVPHATIAAAEKAVTAFFAELPEAVPISAPQDALGRAGNRFRTCGDAQCAQAFAAALGVDFAVVVRLFMPDHSGGNGSVSVALVTPAGPAYTGNEEIDEAGVEQAATRAVDAAYVRLNRGPGPWLMVDGPDGARVRLDSGVPQPLPYTEKHEPGLHRVVIDSGPGGSVLLDTTINLPDDPAHYEVIKAPSVASASVAGTSEAITSDPPEHHSFWQRKRSVWNYVVGGALLAVGGYALANGLQHKLREGDCSNDPCTMAYEMDATSRALLGAGISAVAVGGVVMGVGVLRRPETQGSEAMLQLRGVF